MQLPFRSSLSTEPDSTTGEMSENSLSCILDQRLPRTTLSLPGFGLNRTVLLLLLEVVRFLAQPADLL